MRRSARLLERAVAERGRRVSRHPTRYREDAHPFGACAAGRFAGGRAWSGRMTDFHDLIDTDDLDHDEEERAAPCARASARGRPAARSAPGAPAPARPRSARREVIAVPAPARGVGSRRAVISPPRLPQRRSAAAISSGTRRPSRARSRRSASSRCTPPATGAATRSAWSRSPTDSAATGRSSSGHRPAEAADRQLLRAVADPPRRAVGLVRHVPDTGPHDDRPVLRPVPR